MVPIAPSSTRIRSAATRRSFCSASDIDLVSELAMRSGALLHSSQAGPQSQEMTDGVDQVGAVHRVEVEIGHAAVDQIDHLLGGDRGRDQLAGGGIVVEAVET